MTRLPIPRHRAAARLAVVGAVTALALLAGGTRGAAAGAALEVGIISPQAGLPAFGRVRFIAMPRGSEPVVRIEFLLGGRKIGERTAPPWEIEIDTGETNSEKVFRVVAYGRNGARAESSLTAPAVHVDLAMDLELQQLYVTVTKGGERVLDVPREEFDVRDDGETQTLVTFEHGDVPIAAVLLVDSSQSMQGDRLRAALGGVRAFAKGMAGLDEAALLLFGDHIVHRTAFSGDARALLDGLDRIQAEGGTALNDHLFLALQLLERRQGRRVVVLLSDGIDVESVLEMSQVLSSVRRSQAIVYWLRLRDPAAAAGDRHLSVWHGAAYHAEQLAELERAVADSGGRILDLARVEDSESAFREVLRELRDQVVLGFYPASSKNDGKWHDVQVRLPHRSGYSLRTRAGYYDY